MPSKEEWDAAWEYNRWARARHKRGKRIIFLLVLANLIGYGFGVLGCFLN